MRVFLAATALLLVCFQAAHAQDDYIERQQFQMGTYARVLIYGGENRQADGAFEEIRKLDALLSDYNPNSQVSRISKNAGKEPVKVSPEVIEVLRASKEAAAETGGEFDPTIGALTIGVYRFGRDGRTEITEEGIERAKGLVDYRKLVLTEDTAYLEDEGMMLDLGGIGKGFAIDKAAEALKEEGVTRGIVSLSGDIRVFGEDIPMAVRDPSGRGVIASFRTGAQDLSISTSGGYERRVSSKGKTYHHLIVPGSGWPGQELLSVTVVMPENNTLADAYATAIFVMGKEKAQEFLEKKPGVGAFLVYADGTTYYNEAFTELTKDLKVK